MSDIEDYAYSPYDDLEDILYDADPAPELADDLASHAVHSPVYQEEAAAFELQDYFSDWEYYSDDYMDDDPALLNKRSQGQALKENGGAKVMKRGKKRKLAETRDKLPLDLTEVGLLTRCIKGTVWAEPAERGPPSYKAGQEGKVALMKDWKELFAITDDGWGRAEVGAKVDESWAKDMSLADMGLQNMLGQSFKREAGPENSEYDEENEDEVEEAGEAEYGPEEVEDQVQEVHDLGSVATIEAEAVEGDELPRKRRRLKPIGSTPPISDKPTVDDEENHFMSTTSSISHLQEDVAGIILNGSRDTSPAKDSQVGILGKVDRKRKATEEPSDVDTGPLRSTAASRAKRTTTTMAKSNQKENTTSRQTRNSSKK